MKNSYNVAHYGEPDLHRELAVCRNTVGVKCFTRAGAGNGLSCHVSG